MRTAFLLAPRQNQNGALIVKPPQILREAGLVGPQELWKVDKALYGLQSSPSDWGLFRDQQLGIWTWTRGQDECFLRATSEANLWRLCKRTSGGKGWVTEGYVVIYVDDVLAVGPRGVVSSFMDKVGTTWNCSTPIDVYGKSGGTSIC